MYLAFANVCVLNKYVYLLRLKYLWTSVTLIIKRNIHVCLFISGKAMRQTVE